MMHVVVMPMVMVMMMVMMMGHGFGVHRRRAGRRAGDCGLREGESAEADR
jgi:hypothetical protein